MSSYEKTERGTFLLDHGHLTKATSQHKKWEYEYGGHRYVVTACASDRPAATLLFEPGKDEFTDTSRGSDLRRRELLHFYAAQGLKKQHRLSRTLLARVSDFQLTKALVESIQSIFSTCPPSVYMRCTHKDEAECVRLKERWEDKCFPFPKVWDPF